MAVNLVFFSKSGRRKDIELGDGVTIVGRRPDCDIRIPLLYVSRKHCRFIRKEDQTIVQDLGSANGTFLNSERIMEAVVGPGDKVGVGSVTFTIQIDGEPSDIVQPATPTGTGKKAYRNTEQTSPAQAGISEVGATEEAPPFDDSGSYGDPLSDFDIDEILGEEENPS
jgi:pSer/pThr/pTyr-binding forkhead associated (FHA) protein